MRASQINVLVIEDDQQDFFYLCELLSGEKEPGFVLTNATSLTNATAKLISGQYDVILTDLNLPDSIGFSTFQRLRDVTHEVPVILLSAEGDDALAIRAVQSGAQDYLVKGFIDKVGLVRSILYAIERHTLLAQLEEARRVENFLAYHDQLTQLPNRELFYDRLNQSILWNRRQQEAFSLLFIDLDGFKYVNDRFGHQAGDFLLQVIANRLKSCVRESDTVARLGGDEFGVILHQVQTEQAAQSVCEKVLAATSKPVIFNTNELTVTASIGASFYPRDAKEPDIMVNTADHAMYRAKSQGKNRYQIYRDAADADLGPATTLEINAALNNDRLETFYQPQVDLMTGDVTGFEALARIHDPKRGLLMPREFLGPSDATTLNRLDERMLHNACQQAAAWQQKYGRDFRISVNFNAKLFHAPSVVNLLEREIKEANIKPSNLCIELTENEVMINVQNAINTLSAIKEIGVQLAVDDFGTGHSSLNYLQNFPIDILKIDRAFVQGIPHDHGNCAITCTVIELANALNLRVIAEGVETSEQLHFLMHQQCSEMQGFYFCQPQCARIIEEFLTNGLTLKRLVNKEPHKQTALPLESG